MALSPFWYGALVGLAAWQFFQAVLSIVFHGRTTTVDSTNFATGLILGLIFLTIAFALGGGVV